MRSYDGAGFNIEGEMFNMKRMLFIYNPRAGKGLLKPKLSDIIDIFVKAGYEVTVYPTHTETHIRRSLDIMPKNMIWSSAAAGTVRSTRW